MSALFTLITHAGPLGHSDHTRNREASTDMQVLDGLLTYSRLNDPTFAHGDGPPPTHLKLGAEGKADVKDGGNDQIIAELNDRVSPSSTYLGLEADVQVLIAARSAHYVILVEGVEGAKQDVLSTSVAGFAEGLQSLA
jgi:hypothetical protein